MGKVRDLANYLKSVTREEQLGKLAEIIKDNEQNILDLNRDQLLRGLDSKGNSLEKYKSPGYAKYKQKLNPRGVTDLKLKGDFHENFFMVSELPLIIWSYDEKTDALVKKYGKDIFGLTDQNLSIASSRFITEKFLAWWRSLIKL